VSTPVLRPYQADAVNALLGSASGVAVLPTGAGKSLVIADVVRQSAPCLVMQPSQEILASNVEKIRAFGFNDVAVYSAGAGSKEVAGATYATIGSVVKGGKVIPEIMALKPRKIIIDECHLVNPAEGQYAQLIEQLGCDLNGLTASPYRLHTISDLNSYMAKGGYYTGKVSDIRLLTRTKPKAFKKIVHVTQSADLVAQGYLHQPEYIVKGQGTRGDLLLNSTGSEYSEASVIKWFRKGSIKDEIVSTVQRAMNEGLQRILVFVPLLKESDELVRRMQRLGIAADNISGETPKGVREDRIRGFRSGRIKVMIGVGTLTTGFDMPILDCIIGARPTMSLSLYYQMIGRCVRPHPDKKRAVVFDLVDNFARFGDPLQMRVLATSTGLHHIINSGGRLTGRDLALGPECEDVIDWGQYAGNKLKDLPTDYLQWVVANNKPSEERHTLEAEYQRRTIFGN